LFAPSQNDWVGAACTYRDGPESFIAQVKAEQYKIPIKDGAAVTTWREPRGTKSFQVRFLIAPIVDHDISFGNDRFKNEIISEPAVAIDCRNEGNEENGIYPISTVLVMDYGSDTKWWCQ
jgi:hypothetical protein